MKNKLKFLMIFGALFALFIFLPQATQAAMEWDQVNTNGFGSSGNYNCDFIVTFNNALYVGTGNATGLRVWRSTNGSTWTQVNSNGFGDVSNMNAFGAYVFDGYLYAGTYNINGLEIWRTSNGTTWSQVVGDEVDGNGIGTDENGFGDGGNLYSIEMIEFNNYLYIGTYNNLNAAEVWRTSNGTAWSQTNTVGFDADINNLGSYPMIIFNSRLYIATSNEITGTEVWSTSNGSDWTQVNSDGFGDSNNWVVDSMIVFNDQLYAGTRNDTGGAEIWRTSNGTSWSSVVADQVDGNSTGADENGFNDSNNTRIRKIHNFGDQLYVSVANNSGAEVWTSSNGTSWTQSNTNGFGDNNNDSIGRGAIATFDNQLYTGTYNTNTGAEIWTLADVTNPTITNQSPASNATSVDIDTDISFRTDDEDLGVDSDTIDVTIEGDDVIVNGDCQSGYSCAIGTYGSTGYTVTINPSSNFDYSQ
ncbi:MAG: hypothetical protein HQ538_04095, partial [Parcubacteria group bacterium]|nr:hypothetical protein [Parcubacteria group bacterium]